MTLIKPLADIAPMLLLLGIMTGCTTPPQGTGLAAPEKRIFTVPELTPAAAIPLKVAVYIAPGVFGRSAILNLKDSRVAANSVIQSGQTGTATIAAMTQYFPTVFDEVYLLAHFPDARLNSRKIDLVIVIQDTATSRQVITAEPAGEIWDTQIRMGLYRVDGTRISQYSVMASINPTTNNRPGDTEGIIRWVNRTSQESMYPAMRLALHNFPRAEVMHAIHSQPARDSQARNDLEQINIPLPTMPLEHYLGRQSQLAADNMAMANALVQLNTKVIAPYYARNPAGFIHNFIQPGVLTSAVSQVYAKQLQAIAEGLNPDKQPWVMQNIGGLGKTKPVTTPAKTQATVNAAIQANTVASTTASNDYPQLKKLAALLANLKQPGGDCLNDLRRTKQALLDSAKEAGANAAMLHSAGSGAVIYSHSHCAMPVPAKMDTAQSLRETQRIALCGVQTVNCTMAKVYGGTACQAAVNKCVQEAPTPK